MSTIGPKIWVQCLCTLPSTAVLEVGSTYYVERVVDAWDEDRETMRSALVLSGCPHEEAYPPEWFRPLGGERQSAVREARQP